MKPSFLDRVLGSATYEAFIRTLELGAHNAVPLSNQGDFGFFTAPAGMNAYAQSKVSMRL